MKPSDQNRAIAVAIGWTRVDMRTGYDPAKGKIVDLPDFTKDLNAMHEAEKSLHGRPGFEWPEYKCYQRELYHICTRDYPLNNGCPYGATAAQRAQAFLRTLNLWVE